MNNLEEVDPADEPRTYRQQSFRRRLSVAVAGSTMHFLIAFVLLFVARDGVVGVPDDQRTTIGEISQARGGHEPGAAGRPPASATESCSVDGQRSPSWDDCPRATSSSARARRSTFVVERDGAAGDAHRDADRPQHRPHRRRVRIGSNEHAGSSASSPKRTVDRAASGSTRRVSAAHRRGRVAGLHDNVKALGCVFAVDGMPELRRPDHRPGSRPTGPDASDSAGSSRRSASCGSAAQAADDSLLLGAASLLIAINIFIGMFNLMPLLPLDGGHVAIAVYERIRSRSAAGATTPTWPSCLPLTYAVVVLLVISSG